jgi:hypothetical protein
VKIHEGRQTELLSSRLTFGGVRIRSMFLARHQRQDLFLILLSFSLKKSHPKKPESHLTFVFARRAAHGGMIATITSARSRPPLNRAARAAP